MDFPNELHYTKDHEWISINGDVAKVGITDYAQSELGDIIFIEMPLVNKKYSAGDTIGTIEAVKTVADIYLPLNGTIIEINNNLEEHPEYLNDDPYHNGWVIKIKLESKDYSNLLTKKEYTALIK